MRPIPPFACILSLIALSTTVEARTWHIQPDGLGDAPTIQAGVDSALSGDTVLVASGLYTGPGNRDISIEGKAILVASEGGPSVTTIYCEGAGRGFDVSPGAGETATVRGFSIRGGGAEMGGGVLLRGGTGACPRLVDCRVIGNEASYGGGGVYVTNRVVGCVRRCYVLGNVAPDGGGISIGGDFAKAYVESTVVTGNRATGEWGVGGGISTELIGWVQIRNSTISGNIAAYRGGGLGLRWGDSGPVALQLSIVWDNCAPEAAELYWETPFSFDYCCADTSGIPHPELVTCYECVYSDPLFCDPGLCDGAPTEEGDYSLDASSPCRAENNEIGLLIGALDEGCDALTAVAEDVSVPARALRLFVSPNPSAGEVALRYSLPGAEAPAIRVYDVRGRMVRALAAGEPLGLLVWDGTDAGGRSVAPGVYFVRLSGGEFSETTRITRVR